MRYLILISLLMQYPSVGAVSWDDISRLNQDDVQTVVRVKSDSDVVDALGRVKSQGHIVVSGTRHSQGGHIVYPGAIVLDMTEYNKVISLSVSGRTIVVQSGTTWAQIQQAVNPHGLSIKVMQSSNIFSVGGSLGANVHGRDPSYGPLVETVKSLKLALTSGEIVTASRHQEPELFHAVIGGYGLIGIILEAEIELTDSVQLIKSTHRTDYDDYADDLVANIDEMALHYGRCSIVKDETFLRECFSINYRIANSAPTTESLSEEENVEINSLLFDFSRHTELGKKLRWKLQKEFIDVPGEAVQVNRNNAMRPPIEFLAYESESDTDILQEYFVPVSEFSEFMDGLRRELLENDVNLLSITLRYLSKNDESILNYATDDMIAIALFVNIGIDEASIETAQNWTRKLVALALGHEGTYYLTYQRFPTLDQFQQAYPD
ncbi:MAG: FAD-dependent oxidoreductase [Gammaproteobacteria bacterium]|nr:FAD-dependent oxidoreductase [Gammaproteobacteria bacterium]